MEGHETKCSPVTKQTGRASYQHPTHPPFVVRQRNKLTVILDGVFADYWERLKRKALPTLDDALAMAAYGRYVERNITAIMCTVELCVLRFCETVNIAWLQVLRVGRR